MQKLTLALQHKSRDYLVSVWLSVVLWCDDSKAKRPEPKLMRVTDHVQHIIILCFDEHVATGDKIL